MNTRRLSLDEYKSGILKGDRIILAQAITLVESSLPADEKLASKLIEAIYSYTGNSIRVGITGVPGVGKSTFIESFGKLITERGKKVAILTVDPSSTITKGSILGDKTRMEGLSKNKMAFVRPSSSRETLGGVSNKTREAVLLCEAAGFEVIIIETVGVGQSETIVKSMVDFFLLLMIAGAGDELQGIKKGIMEMADAIAITKADGDNIKKANETRADYLHALHLQSGKSSGWVPKVFTCSAVSNHGIDEAWDLIEKFSREMKASGFFEENRRHQQALWFREKFSQLLQTDFRNHIKVVEQQTLLEQQVSTNKVSPVVAAEKLLETYHQAIKEK